MNDNLYTSLLYDSLQKKIRRPDLQAYSHYYPFPAGDKASGFFCARKWAC